MGLLSHNWERIGRTDGPPAAGTGWMDDRLQKTRWGELQQLASCPHCFEIRVAMMMMMNSQTLSLYSTAEKLSHLFPLCPPPSGTRSLHQELYFPSASVSFVVPLSYRILITSVL